MIDDNLVSVIDVAHRYGKRKATVFKVLKRLGIEPTKLRNSSNGNQFISYITQDECRRVGDELMLIGSRSRTKDFEAESDDFVSAEVGVFYVVQLEPDFDPGRFKVGGSVLRLSW